MRSRCSFTQAKPSKGEMVPAAKSSMSHFRVDWGVYPTFSFHRSKPDPSRNRPAEAHRKTRKLCIGFRGAKDAEYHIDPHLVTPTLCRHRSALHLPIPRVRDCVMNHDTEMPPTCYRGKFYRCRVTVWFRGRLSQSGANGPFRRILMSQGRSDEPH